MMKTLFTFFFILLSMWGCSTDSKLPSDKLNRFIGVYEKGFSVQDFEGYKIQKRGDGYLVDFPDFNHWFAYKFNDNFDDINLRNIETLINKDVLDINDNLVDSLNREVFRRLAIVVEYDIMKVEGDLYKNNLIEISFNAEDVLTYISSTEDTTKWKEQYLMRNNAQKLYDNWYFLKRDKPLDLTNY